MFDVESRKRWEDTEQEDSNLFGIPAKSQLAGRLVLLEILKSNLIIENEQIITGSIADDKPPAHGRKANRYLKSQEGHSAGARHVPRATGHRSSSGKACSKTSA